MYQPIKKKTTSRKFFGSTDKNKCSAKRFLSPKITVLASAIMDWVFHHSWDFVNFDKINLGGKLV